MLITIMLTAVATAKPMDNIVDDSNELVYFYADDHAFSVYFKIYQAGGNHDQPLPLDNYQSIVQKGAKSTSFGWSIRLTPNRKLVAEITSNYPMEVDGYKLKDEDYNIDFQKEADNGWTIEFEEITPTHYNVIIYKDDYHGVSYVTIDPVVGENVQTVYYTFTVCGNWTCDSYNDCEITDSQSCNSVTGLPSGCDNATFEGTYSAYNQSCDYCTPSWSCSTFGSCDVELGIKSCLAVTDANGCYAITNLTSDQYPGALSDYNEACGTGTGQMLAESGTGLARFMEGVRPNLIIFLMSIPFVGFIIVLIFAIGDLIKRSTNNK